MNVRRRVRSAFAVVALSLGLASLAAIAGAAGPGEPLGGDDTGCVPPTKARLDCSVALAKALDKLETSAVKCLAREAKARFDEFSRGRDDAFDQAECRARAEARFETTVERLRGSTCAATPAGANAESLAAALLAALDAANEGPFCDDASGVAFDEFGATTGFVPATRTGLACATRVAKNLRVLAVRSRKCQRTLADKSFRGAAFDRDACDAALAAKTARLAERLEASGKCASCLGAADQAILADAVLARGNAAGEQLYPCPDPVLQLLQARLDRPTLLNLGVQVLISGDENYDASIALRYRQSGAMAWKEGLPLFRVRPETVPKRTVPEQFAGSVFDLSPGTTYEIELRALDADGPVDETIVLEATTRSVPEGPATPRSVPVASAVELAAALAAATAGDVIEIADGLYVGPFDLAASGTADDPIVIRGQSRDGTVLDGGGCPACNVLEVYGSYVHVERLTLRNANRALRFQTGAATGNVARRLRTTDTNLGIASRENQTDFYLCDNLLEGPLVWPHVYFDDGGIYSNQDGILVQGSGHVVCHNDLVGWGDALKTEQEGARAVDFYGNEVRSAYDNGVELDYGEGNVRALRNRFTDNFVPLSFQPIHGGPAYALRNVAVNVAHEQLKFHGIGPSRGPSGVFVYHNTFVSPSTPLLMVTSAASALFEIRNNLFVGPASLDGRVADWVGPVDRGLFDHDGYYPDGPFRFAFAGAGTLSFANFAALQAGGIETGGRILSPPIFQSGLAAPPSYTSTLAPADATLDAASDAIDAATALANVSAVFVGGGPDLGALERGCPIPIYGIRPEGVDETNEPLGCAP